VSGDLDALESQSIFVLREAFNRIDRPALLWSVGKDSNVLIWLARPNLRLSIAAVRRAVCPR
jgi:sulfate adenylyltransferase subunit 2